MTQNRSFLHAALLAWAASGALHAQGKVIEKTYHVTGPAALSLIADDSVINASGCGECSSVQIKVDFRSADPTRYDLKETQSGSAVRFELRRKEVHSWFGGWSQGPVITVLVPTRADTNLITSSGSVSLRRVRGQEKLHSGSGSIEAEEVEGSVEADTGSGGLHFHALQGSLAAHTGSGTIDADGSVSLRRLTAGSGSVHLTLAPGSSLSEGALVQTGSGSVELRMAPAVRAELRVNTGSGGIHCDLPLTVQGEVDRQALHGVLNGGGPTLRVTTGSGSVLIRSL